MSSEMEDTKEPVEEDREEDMENVDSDPEEEDDNHEEELENADSDAEVDEEVLPIKKGRGRPKKEEDAEEEDLDQVENDYQVDEALPIKKGRGRPKKAALGRGRPPKKERYREEMPDDQEDDVAPPPAKKGRGRPKKAYVETEDVREDEGPENEDIDGEAKGDDTPAKKGRGRPKKGGARKVSKRHSSPKKGRGQSKKESGDPEGESGTPNPKKPKIRRQRSIEPGKLREGGKISYKDESSDEEIIRYERHERQNYAKYVSSDSEADYGLERKLARNWTGETKEAGSLRERTRRQSYKDDSESDIESGFESDIIPPSKLSAGTGRGRGRPKKSAPKVKGRGRPPKAGSPDVKKGVRKVGKPKKKKPMAATHSDEDNQSEPAEEVDDQSEEVEPETVETAT